MSKLCIKNYLKFSLKSINSFKKKFFLLRQYQQQEFYHFQLIFRQLKYIKTVCISLEYNYNLHFHKEFYIKYRLGYK